MFQIKNARPALILVDIQKGFDDIAYWGGSRNNLNAEHNAHLLLELFRKKELPVFHIQHCSSNKNSPLHENNKGNEHKDVVAPLSGEVVIKKNVNSAFIGTSLQEQLDEQKIDTIILCGLTTDHCVSTTARMSGNFGYATFVVEDACATFAKKGINDELYSAETNHLVALAHLKDEFATILKTSDVIASFE